MSNSSKKRKALLREKDRLAQQREQELIDAKAEALKRRTGGFARSEPTQKLKVLVQSKLSNFGKYSEVAERIEQTKKIGQSGASHELPVNRRVAKPKEKPLSKEMLERENKAKEEYEFKKARVAPVGNKQGYGYFSDDMVEALKAGGLRRR